MAQGTVYQVQPRGSPEALIGLLGTAKLSLDSLSLQGRKKK